MSDERSDEFAGDGPSFSDEELEAALAGFEEEFRKEEQQTAAGDEPASADSFDEELEGLLGNKAKSAIIITQLASAELLAAFCQLADVSAVCLEDSRGAVGVLRNLDGDGPEAAAADLTTVVSGMPVVLTVNRADKLEATLYTQGKAGQGFAPPLLFAQTPTFVEDLMLGISTLSEVVSHGVTSVDSGSLDREEAMAIIAKHTRFGRGTSKIQ